MAVTFRRPLIALMSIAVFALPMQSAPAYAEEFLCDATQASSDTLPLLDAACPIGKGMWGKQKPKGQASYFWIQCGVYGKPLALPEAKKIYQHISADVWAKPEGKAYRCLIGPYKAFSEAKSDLAKVKKLPDYKEAFIREIVKGAPTAKAVPVTKSAAKPPTKVAQQKTTVLPAPSKPEPKTLAQAKPEQPRNQGVAIRQHANINGVEYKVPYSMFGNDQFYMEHELPWNRMDYEMAYKTCYRMGMRLATEKEWQALLNADVMSRDKWPMHLPYWGADRIGLFYSGKVNHLKGTSLLNVMCVK
ncbi:MULTISPECIES: SPOR domain-containing protein [Vibrio]|uniref:SPOR domain-containing protein n=1 Tax=Vibrio TaxID=662 RepID=UPI001EFC9032|nr:MULTISPECIES: SPOR domain-containing protein [Vibrio]MCG9680245.1 SPOR domain-containing protein [Vibrio sp. Isolate24]USD32480.1 SPOR domain-containing protein [Vibrio sp. SCSIO 43186]USD45522.1 SPOR domain-containing protein [Vibrio sp. SCSIO 43145]USD69605.1 SPOR domain-containing protein [Vibrio sp. SCSIO 43139]USD97298.1 SPOR domain-containing protein [Vibrio coralliilyticus]